MNTKYYIQEPDIKCPYCDKDYYNDGEINDIEKKVELECDACEKKFWAEASIAYSTYSDCSINDMPHEWERTFVTGWYSCKNCCQYEYREKEDLGDKP